MSYPEQTIENQKAIKAAGIFGFFQGIYNALFIYSFLGIIGLITLSFIKLSIITGMLILAIGPLLSYLLIALCILGLAYSGYKGYKIYANREIIAQENDEQRRTIIEQNINNELRESDILKRDFDKYEEKIQSYKKNLAELYEQTDKSAAITKEYNIQKKKLDDLLSSAEKELEKADKWEPGLLAMPLMEKMPFLEGEKQFGKFRTIARIDMGIVVLTGAGLGVGFAAGIMLWPIVLAGLLLIGGTTLTYYSYKKDYEKTVNEREILEEESITVPQSILTNVAKRSRKECVVKEYNAKLKAAADEIINNFSNFIKEMKSSLNSSTNKNNQEMEQETTHLTSIVNRIAPSWLFSSKHSIS